MEQKGRLPVHSMHTSSKGFTLVEVLVVIPIVILVIATIVGAMTLLSGDALVANQRIRLTESVQSALSAIEQDVRMSYTIMNTSANIPSPQGVGSNFTGTGAFADNTKYLVLELPATDASPYSNATRNLVRRANTPNPCGASSEVNTTFTVQVIYFVSNSVLYRRTYVPDFIASDLCSTPWQQNSCTAAYITAASRCRVADETIAENVTQLSIEYFQSPEQTTATTDAEEASTVRVAVSTGASVANKAIGFTGAVRASKIN